jgi:hypothetical protein
MAKDPITKDRLATKKQTKFIYYWFLQCRRKFKETCIFLHLVWMKNGETRENAMGQSG